MEFEFDPQKSASNFAKHGIDFRETTELWGDTRALVVPARSTDETRFAIIATLNGKVWTCIFTLREHKVRIISARKARDEEKNKYDQS